MRVTRHAYVVDGWGVGELWEADGRLVLAHAAPAPAAGEAEELAPDDPTGMRTRPRRAATYPPTRSPTGFPTHPRGTPGVPTETLSRADAHPGADFVTSLLQGVHSFYAGEPVDFADVPLDLDWCTGFQRAVAETLRSVAWGEVVSYGELAALAGHPRAHRAVGTFCASNRFSLFLPCHRVIASDGIGSYGPSGVATKRRLLRLEGHDAL